MLPEKARGISKFTPGSFSLTSKSDKDVGQSAAMKAHNGITHNFAIRDSSLLLVDQGICEGMCLVANLGPRRREEGLRGQRLRWREHAAYKPL